MFDSGRKLNFAYGAETFKSSDHQCKPREIWSSEYSEFRLDYLVLTNACNLEKKKAQDRCFDEYEITTS